jgi:hypothetical protein
MLLFFPFLTWLAAATSLAVMMMLAAAGDLRPRGAAVVVALFLGAAYCQFLSGSSGLAAAGLGVQTLLAIALIVRWRLTA